MRDYLTIRHRLLYAKVNRESVYSTDYSPFEFALEIATDEELREAMEILNTGRGKYGYRGKRWRFMMNELAKRARNK